VKLPTCVKVGPRIYRINSLDPRVATADARWGDCSSLELEIRVRADLPGAVKGEVLLHEILHATCDVFIGTEGRKDEERWVDGLAVGISAVMVDNPGLFATIAKMLNS
jgi:hypothetical protein